MSGIIPVWMVNKNMTLMTLDLSNNFFEGQIPCGSGASIDIINLSHNLLSGLFPSCLNLQYVSHELLQGNKLTGSFPIAFLNSSGLVTLDIRDNSFLAAYLKKLMDFPV